MSLHQVSNLAELQNILPKEGTLIVTSTHLCTTTVSGFTTIPDKPLCELGELYALDARLEGTLKTLYERNRGDFETFTFTAMYLHLTLDLWQTPQYLVDTKRRKQHYCYITTITHLPGQGVDEALIIRTVQPDLDNARGYAASDATVVAGVTSSTVNVYIPWFDRHYAGWRERLSVAKALTLSHKEIAAFVLDKSAKKSSAPDSQLDGISFE